MCSRGGMAAWDPEMGLQREIHNIENSPFRTRFAQTLSEMIGSAGIGCISDSDPQPLLIRSNLGTYALCTIGVIQNAEELISQFLSFSGGHFEAMRGGHVNTTELVAAMIDQKSSLWRVSGSPSGRSSEPRPSSFSRKTAISSPPAT